MKNIWLWVLGGLALLWLLASGKVKIPGGVAPTGAAVNTGTGTPPASISFDTFNNGVNSVTAGANAGLSFFNSITTAFGGFFGGGGTGGSTGSQSPQTSGGGAGIPQPATNGGSGYDFGYGSDDFYDDGSDFYS